MLTNSKRPTAAPVFSQLGTPALSGRRWKGPTTKQATAGPACLALAAPRWPFSSKSSPRLPLLSLHQIPSSSLPPSPSPLSNLKVLHSCSHSGRFSCFSSLILCALHQEYHPHPLSLLKRAPGCLLDGTRKATSPLRAKMFTFSRVMG